ncbi:MAG: cytochrome c [Gammaproteobacteria bacterium]
MKLIKRTAVALLLSGYAASGWGYPWDQDMVDQPSQKPQESRAPADPGAVPVVGGEFLAAAETEAEQFDGKDAAASLVNPVPATLESIERGAYLYELNCQVCHGKTGVGDGPVGSKFENKEPVDLNDAYTQDQTDGELFFTLTRGRVEMPFYRDALSQHERWDVVNYVKSEFGEQ